MHLKCIRLFCGAVRPFHAADIVLCAEASQQFQLVPSADSETSFQVQVSDSITAEVVIPREWPDGAALMLKKIQAKSQQQQDFDDVMKRLVQDEVLCKGSLTAFLQSIAAAATNMKSAH